MPPESEPTIPDEISPEAVASCHVHGDALALILTYGSLYYLARSTDAGASWTVGTVPVSTQGQQPPGWDTELATRFTTESESRSLLAAVTTEMSIFMDPGR